MGDFRDKTLLGVTMSVCCCCESSLKPSSLSVEDMPSIKGFDGGVVPTTGGLLKSTLLCSAGLNWRESLLDFKILPLKVTLKVFLKNILSLKCVKNCLCVFSAKDFLQVLKVEENATIPFFTLSCVSERMDNKSFQSCWISNMKELFDLLTKESCSVSTDNSVCPGQWGFSQW